MTFSRLLVANRGEIACRVIATARRLGIASVAVHSDADAGARHVAMADEAVRIGPAPASESYLLGARIVEAAVAAGADAVHPGYGFLSENPEFAEAVEAAGLAFVGPPPDAIRAMGLKDAAKDLMARAGVPVVPGYHGEAQDAETLAREAEAIGYPVLVKARAGGGGKGMRLVEEPGGFGEALASARREAEASFGDPRCLVEKFVPSPRHVEIQVLADGHGAAVHLFERDCSLQRRHQKVIEEAPAPGMAAEVRDAMGRAAVEAARAIGYRGAGTVEFIADGAGGLRADGFWFMEMNTRLQVEHPVTEAIAGLDLVEMQLLVAAGERLPFGQDDLSVSGHAFEARICAEDPARDFLPSTGRLDRLAFPEGAAEFRPAPLRVDSGVRAGDEVGPHYDPMIAKLVVHGPDRRSALAALADALEETEIAGPVTNVPFLAALARHGGFARGEVDTGLVARDIVALCAAEDPPAGAAALAALSAAGLLPAPDGTGPWEALRGFRAWGAAPARAALARGGETLDVRVEADGGLRVDGAPVRAEDLGGGRWRVEAGGAARRLALCRAGGRITVIDRGRPHVFDLPDPLERGAAAAAGGDAILSPMPGRVSAIRAAVGDRVAAGAPLVVLEAMKMEHALRAPRDGTVAELPVPEGEQVAEGTLLARLEDGDG